MKGTFSHVHLAEEETEANMLLKVTELARTPAFGQDLLSWGGPLHHTAF